MLSDDAALAVVDALEDLGIPYMLVGAFSVNCYAPPRSTQDADFVISIGDVSISVIADRLGPRFDVDPQLGFETVTMTMRYVARIRKSHFKVELFLLRDDPYDQSRFRRRQRVETLGREAWVAEPSDVVITKLRWSRQGKRHKDMDDARNVLRMMYSELDWPYIQRWCDEHGTRDLLDDLVNDLRERGLV